MNCSNDYLESLTLFGTVGTFLVLAVNTLALILMLKSETT